MLAKEYDYEMQELVAENRTLEINALQLQQDNRELKDRVQKVGRLWSPPLSKAATPRLSLTTGCATRDTTARDSQSDASDASESSSSSPVAAAAEFERREEQLKSELDDERLQSWELGEELDRSRHENSELCSQVKLLVGECREQEALHEASEAGAEALHRRLLEMAEAAEAQRPPPAHAGGGGGGGCRSRPTSCGAVRRPALEAGGRSLLRDLQASELLRADDPEAGSPPTPQSLAAFQQVEELRAQLMNAELEVQRRHAEHRQERCAVQAEAGIAGEEAAERVAAAEARRRQRAAGRLAGADGGAARAMEVPGMHRGRIGRLATAAGGCGSPGPPGTGAAGKGRKFAGGTSPRTGRGLLGAAWPAAFRAR